MKKVHFIILCRCLMFFLTVGLYANYCSPGFIHPSANASETKQSEQIDIKNIQTSVFHSVTLEPAKVAEGDQAVVTAVFSISKDDHRDTLPVQYCYEIQKQGAILFRSPTNTIDVVNGAKSVLEIKFEVPGGNGDYKLVLKLIYSEGTDRADLDFSIVSPEEAHAYAYRAGLQQGASSIGSSIEERLVGKWRFGSPDPDAPGPELTIKKENNELIASVSRKDARTHWVKLRKSGKSLVLRSKSEDLNSDCWFVVEDVITFNDRMDNMPVRSRVLEGSRCVSIGKVSESTLCRIH